MYPYTYCNETKIFKLFLSQVCLIISFHSLTLGDLKTPKAPPESTHEQTMLPLLFDGLHCDIQ